MRRESCLEMPWGDGTNGCAATHLYVVQCMALARVPVCVFVRRVAIHATVAYHFHDVHAQQHRRSASPRVNDPICRFVWVAAVADIMHTA